MKKYDLAVVGGGPAGVAAAVSAAREGLNVVLIEKSGSFGGAINNNLVYPFMPYWTNDKESGTKKILSAGIFTEMRELSDKLSSCKDDFEFKSEFFKMALDKLVSDENIDVLFHSVLSKVETKEDKINKISVLTSSGNLDIESEFFIDATGNGDLFSMAGCEFLLGREKDNLCQPMTTCFRMSGVDIDIFKKDQKMLNEKYKKLSEEGKIINPREDILTFLGLGEGIVHFNTTRIVKMDPTNVFDVSKAEIEARKQILEMVSFLKENSKAFEKSTVISIAADIGIRESRKLKGKHILTQDELKNLTVFEDSIALGNYDIDIHNPEGSGTSHYYFKKGEYYTIPYRSLLPNEYTNLLVSGRCISATHEAQASIRIIPICVCLGQAAGLAAAVAHLTGKNAHTLDVKLLQEKLKKSGAQI